MSALQERLRLMTKNQKTKNPTRQKTKRASPNHAKPKLKKPSSSTEMTTYRENQKMGSLKINKQGKQSHWTDYLNQDSNKKTVREVKQKPSLDGQKPLFADVSISHLENTPREKRSRRA